MSQGRSFVFTGLLTRLAVMRAFDKNLFVKAKIKPAARLLPFGERGKP